MANSIIRRQFRHVNYKLTIWIIAINVLIFVSNLIFQGLALKLAMNPLEIMSGHYWQFLTYMFSHEGFSHLILNMLVLLFFGFAVEEEMGSKEFLLFYLLTGFLAGVLSFFVYMAFGSTNINLIGASGAGFAVLLAFAVFFPTARIFVFGILPVRASLLVLIYITITVVFLFTSSRSGVAHITHLGGVIFAWLYFLIRFGINPAKSLFYRQSR